MFRKKLSEYIFNVCGEKLIKKEDEKEYWDLVLDSDYSWKCYNNNSSQENWDLFSESAKLEREYGLEIIGKRDVTFGMLDLIFITIESELWSIIDSEKLCVLDFKNNILNFRHLVSKDLYIEILTIFKSYIPKGKYGTKYYKEMVDIVNSSLSDISELNLQNIGFRRVSELNNVWGKGSVEIGAKQRKQLNVSFVAYETTKFKWWVSNIEVYNRYNNGFKDIGFVDFDKDEVKTIMVQLADEYKVKYDKNILGEAYEQFNAIY